MIVAGQNSPYGRRDLRDRQEQLHAAASASPGTRRATARRSCAADTGSTTTSRWSASSCRTRSSTRRSPTRRSCTNPVLGESARRASRPRAPRAAHAQRGTGAALRDARSAAVEHRRSSGSSTRAASSTSSYVGSRGDDLMRPVDINQPQPADVVGQRCDLNLARPVPRLRRHHDHARRRREAGIGGC